MMPQYLAVVAQARCALSRLCVSRRALPGPAAALLRQHGSRTAIAGDCPGASNVRETLAGDCKGIDSPIHYSRIQPREERSWICS